MKTCKYCGTFLKFVGVRDNTSYFACSYCDMIFPLEETSENRKRKSVVPEFYEMNYFKSTKELLNKNTIELFILLKECRRDWFNVYTTLKKIFNLEPDQIPEKEGLDEAVKPLYKEYLDITKKKFVIENILLEKAGFLPEKITDNFLSELIDMSIKQSEKPMYIYIKKDRKVV